MVITAAPANEERRQVLKVARRRHFRRGEVLFHEGDPGDTLHLIDRGHVAMRTTTPRGDVATLNVVGPGGYFGEMALVSEEGVRTSTVVALDAVETLSLLRNQFVELRTAHPGVNEILVVALTGEVRRLSARLTEAIYVPVETRIFRRLVELAAMFTSGDKTTPIPLTQDDLASLAGTTRPSVNKVLRAAQDDGLLRISRGTIDILDSSLLGRRAR